MALTVDRTPALPGRGHPAAHRDPALLVVVGVAAVLSQLPVFDRGLALLDEGWFLALADELNRGRSLYRDVYVNGGFPAAFHLLAAWFRVAGSSVWASRLLAVAEFSVFATAVVALARALVSRGTAVVLAVAVLSYRLWALPDWQTYGDVSLAATCVTVAAALVFGSPSGAGGGTPIVAGALAGASILAEPHLGGAVSATLMLALAVHALATGRRALGVLLRFLAGGAAVLPALAALHASGAFDALVAQGMRMPPEADASSFLPILSTLGRDAIPPGGEALLRRAPLVLFVVAAVAWLPRADAARLVVLAWAGGCLLALPLRHDRAHLAMIYPPALVLAAALVHGGASRLPRGLGVAIRTAAVGAVLALAWWTAGLAEDLRRTLDRPLAVPRAGVRAAEIQAATIEDVLEWIARETPPGAPVPVWPAAPMIGFLAGRETAGGFHVIRATQPPDRDARIVEDLEDRRIDAIVYGLSPDAPVGRFRDDAPALYTHLVRRYQVAEVFGREARGPIFLGLRRRPLHPPLGAPVLAHLPERHRRWPFAEVLSVPLGLPDSPVVVSTAMPFPHVRPQIEFRYGVNPERWLELPRGPFTFEVYVEGERAWIATIDPTTRLVDRRWIPGAVDLGRFAGSPLGSFGFRVTAPALPPAPDDLVGFEDPRITGE